MNLRIIGGQFRNRPLKSPKGLQTRPTSAILRKSVFDICQNAVEDAAVLDLFAGSGAIGLEALSRGAKSATFVDSSRNAIQCVKQNIELLDVEPLCTVMQGDVIAFLKRFAAQNRTFDIIYIDPPYEEAAVHLSLIPFIDTSSLLAPGGHLFAEEAYPSTTSLEKLPLTNLQHKGMRHFSKSLLHEFIRL